MLKFTSQIWKKIISKIVHRELVPKYNGPIEVLKIVEKIAYKLKLPDRLNVHLTFHVSYLNSFNQDEMDESRMQLTFLDHHPKII